jgi:type I restriction enzyme S subunit
MKTLVKQIRGVSYKPEDLHDALDNKSIILLRSNNIDNGMINFDNIVFVDKKKVSPEQILRKGDVLICASSGSKELVGKAATVEFEKECTFGAFCKVVRPMNVDNAGYLGMFYQSPYYRKTISALSLGANINNIRNEHIDALTVKWPSNIERQTAFNILKMISNILSLRRRQLDLLDDLVKARFVEMFGDPVSNPKGWEELRLDSIADIVSGITKGRKILSKELFEVPYMAVSNVKNGYIDWTTVKTIFATQAEIEQYRLMPNDVLMTEGGDPDKLGRGAIINEPPNNCIHQNHIFRVRLNLNYILPIFMEQYLQHHRAKRYFLGCAKQTTGIASINMKQLKALPVLIPPLSLQQSFASFVSCVERQKSRVRSALEESQLLFDSMMQRYFG